ncbi:hypothetical protein DTO045G8_812 [Paecilomyces variotii]|nr:hypothetical protein DTO045G8_812 [Paecilomyces variotii]
MVIDLSDCAYDFSLKFGYGDSPFEETGVNAFAIGLSISYVVLPAADFNLLTCHVLEDLRLEPCLAWWERVHQLLTSGFSAVKPTAVVCISFKSEPYSDERKNDDSVISDGKSTKESCIFLFLLARSRAMRVAGIPSIAISQPREIPAMTP